MSGDPTLELFQKLGGVDVDARSPEKEEPEFPGNIPLKNVGENLDNRDPEWLTSLPYQEMVVGASGEVKRFYSIGALARALGKKPVTIRSWEQKGWLPQASYRTPAPQREQVPGKIPKGRRLYSKEQVVFLVKAYTDYVVQPSKANWPGFRNYVKRYYPKR